MSNSVPEIVWTLIVPAAGSGTRMGSSIPKALIEVHGVSLIERATHELRKHSNEIILIIKSDHKNSFKEVFHKEGNQEIRFLEQDIPRGNAFAVHHALSAVTTEYAVVVWGDHVGAEYFPANKLNFELNTSNPDLCLPLSYVKRPYVYFELLEGKFVAFHETSKGAKVVENGISDVGVFAIKVKAVLPYLDKWIEENEKIVDLNFLTFFCSKLSEELKIKALMLDEKSQFLHMGINNLDELEDYKKISLNLIRENTTTK
jgi:bifunctional N-acetylglucosamine-1-phosphate-uridyltransferase/glucosamine-1-phosphate-acetyltransferase GlmU-like protein